MSKYEVAYECGGTCIAFDDWGFLCINGTPVASVPNEKARRAISDAIDSYGDAMWDDGYDCARKAASGVAE